MGVVEIGTSTPSTRFRSVGELLSSVPPRRLVGDILPARGLAVLYGQSGSGKTFATLDLCAALARGVPWFGHDMLPDDDDGQSDYHAYGYVAYVACEGLLANRIRAYLEHHNLEPGALDAMKVLQASVDLLGERGLGELLHDLDGVHYDSGGVNLVVIDTLNRSMPGGDENSSRDMGQMVAAAKAIEERYQCLVLYVHHSGKDQQKGARGHSSLKAAADVELCVQDHGGSRVITAEKVRDGEAGDIGAFRLEPVTVEVHGHQRTSCAVVPAEAVGQLRVRGASRHGSTGLVPHVAEWAGKTSGILDERPQQIPIDAGFGGHPQVELPAGATILGLHGRDPRDEMGVQRKAAAILGHALGRRERSERAR